ncbi:MAG: hypothetical protein AAGA93_08510 [Actinomycetota bacterium]
MALSDTNEPKGRSAAARLPRLTFGLGAAAFVAIGLLHTLTQATTLSGAEVQAAYRAGGDIDISGRVIDGWDLFAGTSLLMGFFAVAIGLLDAAVLVDSGRHHRLPPVSVSAVNVAVLVGIVAVGATLLGPIQLVGGSVGIVLFGITLNAARRSPSA